MPYLKQLKDIVAKKLLGGDTVPRELLDLHDYFRLYGSINFTHKQEGKLIVSVSTNFRHGSIITSARNWEELDSNIKDAILTSFDVPSAYADEARIERQGKPAEKGVYALT